MLSTSSKPYMLAAYAGMSALGLRAQAPATGQRSFIPSAFVTFGIASAGIENSRNVTVAAGADLAFHAQSVLRPAFEIRGMIPVSHGASRTEKNILAGVKLSYPHHVTPYGTVLFGLGQLHYSPYVTNPAGTVAYTYSSSPVLSFGGGLSIAFSSMLSLVVDGQLQRYSVPVTPSRLLYTNSLAVGIAFTPALHGPHQR